MESKSKGAKRKAIKKILLLIAKAIPGLILWFIRKFFSHNNPKNDKDIPF